LNFKAIIFDMDGLVLDSETGYFAAWQQAASEMGYGLNDQFCDSLSGAPGALIRQRLIAHFGVDFDIQRFYALSNQAWQQQVRQHGIPVKTGFFLLMQKVGDLKLPFCLATNSRRQDAEQCLNFAGLTGVFSCIISRDDVKTPKPAADVFLKAADELGFASKDCLVLEDSPVGVAAAVAANCPCIFVPSCLPADEHAACQADRVLVNLIQVADFISAEFEHSL
jgi:beta-phosphoglucomutase-like phosphatase (HAD superfamily)